MKHDQHVIVYKVLKMYDAYTDRRVIADKLGITGVSVDMIVFYRTN